MLADIFSKCLSEIYSLNLNCELVPNPGLTSNSPDEEIGRRSDEVPGVNNVQTPAIISLSWYRSDPTKIDAKGQQEIPSQTELNDFHGFTMGPSIA